MFIFQNGGDLNSDWISSSSWAEKISTYLVIWMKSYFIHFFFDLILAKYGQRMYPIHTEHSFRLDSHEIEIPIETPLKMDGFLFKKLRIGIVFKKSLRYIFIQNNTERSPVNYMHVTSMFTYRPRKFDQNFPLVIRWRIFNCMRNFWLRLWILNFPNHIWYWSWENRYSIIKKQISQIKINILTWKYAFISFHQVCWKKTLWVTVCNLIHNKL